MGEGDNGERRVSYWLIPAEPDKSHLSEIIADLARRFDGPIFEPHVTLYSGRAEDTDDVEDIVVRATAGVSEIVLRTAGIGHSSEFTRTLFVRLEMSESLRRFASALKSRMTGPDPYTLKPHLSLLYAEVDLEARKSLAAEIYVPGAIRFNALHAISTGAHTESRSDVERWGLLAGRALQFAR